MSVFFSFVWVFFFFGGGVVLFCIFFFWLRVLKILFQEGRRETNVKKDVSSGIHASNILNIAYLLLKQLHLILSGGQISELILNIKSTRCVSANL